MERLICVLIKWNIIQSYQILSNLVETESAPLILFS
jgi:hypothetical protein